MLLFALVVPPGAYILLAAVHDAFPDVYNEMLSRLLGIGCSVAYALSPEDEERLVAEGFDPQAVAAAIAASEWCRSVFNGDIDIGIELSIHEHESGSGTNMGSCDGITAARNNPNLDPDLEESAARWLLSRWKNYNVRARNPVAAQYIYADYSGYTGHCSAGEMGAGGFIPTTAFKICYDALSKSGDIDVESCDFWSIKTEFHAMAYWLNAIDYRASLSDEEKVTELYGWNHSESYRWLLVNRANEINEIIGDVSVSSVPSMTWGLDENSFTGWLRLQIIELLTALDMLPEATNWLEWPIASEEIKITNDYMDRSQDPDGHPAIDISCVIGTEILAVADGTVVVPSPGTLMDHLNGPDDFGISIWISHPGGLFTLYAHLSQSFVEEEQHVRQGEVIGLCGNTGNSTGSHLHFAVADKHPDEFVTYRDTNPGWLNPHDYLGKCGRSATTA